MSSNSKAKVPRLLALAALTASVAACASAPPGPGAALTPTQQYAPQVEAHPDQILLAPHAAGVSPTQAAALTHLVARWRESGGGPIVVQAPSRGGASVYGATTGVQAELQALGVQEDNIELAGYAGDDRPNAPIVVGFEHYVADVPVCGRNWSSFTTEINNRPNSNFGCAVNANMAALVANPADLAQPQAMDPPDAGRRETVLGKYRSGMISSSAKDDQADTQISDAVQ